MNAQDTKNHESPFNLRERFVEGLKKELELERFYRRRCKKMTDSTTNHEDEYPDDSNLQDYTQNNHGRWLVITQGEGGSKTRPCIVLPDEPTGRRWRITYEEMTE